ncbi:hypothetical protein [Aequorivita sp. Q41]
METQEITSKEKNKKSAKSTRIQLIKFAIGLVIGVVIYLIVKLIF